MKTIYADFNNFDSDGSMPLTCIGSVESIESLENGLEEGEEVWLTDEVELRARARVFRLQDGTWEARSDDWKFEEISGE